jgi:hypothetical protein
MLKTVTERKSFNHQTFDVVIDISKLLKGRKGFNFKISKLD